MTLNPEEAAAKLKAAGFKVTTGDQKKEKEEKDMSKPKGLLKQKVAQLREKLAKAQGLNQADTEATIKALKEVAKDYAGLLPEAQATLQQLNKELGGEPGRERWRRNPDLKADGEAAEEVVQACRENPYVGQILAEQRRDATTELREKATTNLHKACKYEMGEVAVRVQYEDKFTKQPRTRWIRFEANTEGHQGQGHIVESTVPFLTGTDREGNAIWFDLGTPPAFAEIRSPELRKAFVSLYKFEEDMAARDAKIKEILDKRTISVTRAMAKEVGYVAAHHRDWQTPKGRGPITYGADATGECLILREFFAPEGQIDFSDLIGKEQPLGKLDPRFDKVIRYRLGYEANQAARDAAGEIEVPPAENK